MNTDIKLKNIQTKIIIVLSILIAICIATIIALIRMDTPVFNNTTDNNFPTEQPIHAPNMWVHWMDYSEEPSVYDAYTIDWRCIDNADETYWAVHCWDFGYAGFQLDLSGNKVLLMSLWDLDDGTKPVVEYFSSDYNYGDFTHEGSGAYVFTPYEWEVGTWYSMKVEISYANDSTYLTQYIKEENAEWQKTACISYPVYYEFHSPPASFQEDYCPNNLKRSCEIRNAGGRIMDTQQWKQWDACDIVTSYYPDFGANPDNFLDNISFDCNYEVNDSTIKLISGGSGFEPNDKTYPVTIPLS